MIPRPPESLSPEKCIKVHFECSGEFLIVFWLEYRCTHTGNEVGTLSGNNVVVLQVRAAVSSMCRNAKGCRLTLGSYWLFLGVVGVLSDRDAMTSDGCVQGRHELARSRGYCTWRDRKGGEVR